MNLAGVKTGLRSLYVSDEDFKADFCVKALPTTRSANKARYLLAELEHQASQGTPVDSQRLTLEHVYPTNAGLAWSEHFRGDTDGDLVNWIGNLTLLPMANNRDLGACAFADKRAAFADSGLRINRNLGNVEEWTPDALRERQAWLADLACARWRIEFE